MIVTNNSSNNKTHICSLSSPTFQKEGRTIAFTPITSFSVHPSVVVCPLKDKDIRWSHFSLNIVWPISSKNMLCQILPCSIPFIRSEEDVLAKLYDPKIRSWWNYHLKNAVKVTPWGHGHFLFLEDRSKFQSDDNGVTCPVPVPFSLLEGCLRPDCMTCG